MLKSLSKAPKKVVRMKFISHPIARQIHNNTELRDSCKSSCGDDKKVRTRCTLIPGDGVFPELTAAMEKIFKAVKAPVDFDKFTLSDVDPVPQVKYEDVKKSIKTNRLCIKGVLDRSDMNVLYKKPLSSKLIVDLDLYANVVVFNTLPGVKTRHKKVNTVVIRESTEGEYSAIEHESVKGVVESLKIITREKTKRIAKFAFDYATKNKRKKVTIVHKANIMKLGDGLFLRTCEQISKLYPRIKFEKMIVDNTTMQLVSHPEQFDVMVTPNLYGNIVNNLTAGLVGGAGVVPGVSYSTEIAVFEPGARHTYAQAAGKNVANPTAMILCGMELLRHIGLRKVSENIGEAMKCVLKDGKMTKDVGGSCSTSDYVDAIIEKL